MCRSFGILLWEIFTTGQFPFAELSDSEVVEGVCYEFQRLLQPVFCPNEMYVVTFTLSFLLLTIQIQLPTNAQILA